IFREICSRGVANRCLAFGRQLGSNLKVQVARPATVFGIMVIAQLCDLLASSHFTQFWQFFGEVTEEEIVTRFALGLNDDIVAVTMILCLKTGAIVPSQGEYTGSCSLAKISIPICSVRPSAAIWLPTSIALRSSP